MYIRTTNLSCSLLHVNCEVKVLNYLNISIPGGEGPEDSRREAGSRGVEGSLEWWRSVALKMCLVSRSNPIQNTDAPEENSEEGVEDQLRLCSNI